MGAKEDGPCTTNLSEFLIADDLAMSLLSVPALVIKRIAVPFPQGKALFIDLKED